MESLSRIHQQFAASVYKIAKNVERCHSIRDSLHIASSKFQVISLLDCWGLFCRELILISAGSKFETISGNRGQGIFTSKYEAAIEARRNRHGQIGDEPRWHDANLCISKAKKFKLINIQQIVDAIGDSNSPVDHIRLLRNFCAHEKSSNCYEKLAASEIGQDFAGGGVLDFLSDILGDGRSRIQFWTDELSTLAYAACK